MNFGKFLPMKSLVTANFMDSSKDFGKRPLWLKGSFSGNFSLFFIPSSPASNNKLKAMYGLQAGSGERTSIL